ncbi:MAG: Cell shape-determining protein MreC precursor [Firmicutes bacterium ADurb.Bin354]|nr:MAG: Cell shape-determining protein MreC precursor [Firmicutes bacterium ADurb.Bin354]
MSPVLKKKQEKKKIPGKYLLLLVTIICIGMMVVTFTTDIKGKALNSAVAVVVVPFQKAISHTSSELVALADEKKEIDELKAQNEELKKRIDELTSENTLLAQDYYELNNLRTLFSLNETYSEYNKTGARIIAADSGNWFSTFIIDKGSQDGIKPNMNVIAGAGLVGIVTETGDNWARVNTIINDNANVSASILHSQDNMIVTGSMELIEKGVISYSDLLDTNNDTAEGDKVVTSDISSRYLPGILIGYVDTVETDPNNMTKSGMITPVVDFEHLSEVLVITELKQDTEK